MNITQQIVNALWLGSVYSLFALGYALVFSVLGLLNLAHSAVFMWGAYFGLLFTVNLGLPILISAPIAIFCTGILGIVLDRVAFAPLRKRNAPRIAQLISSIGAATLLLKISQIIFGAQPKNFPLDIVPTDPIPGLPFRVTVFQVLIFVIAIISMVLLRLLVMKTRQGQAMRTVAFNERIAALLGIPVDAIYRLTFFLAGAMAGTAGILYGLAYNSVTPFMGEAVALKGLTVIVLGGLGSIEGAVIGGFVVAGLEVFSIAFGSSDFREAIIFILLFVILVVRPQGLVGTATSDRA